MNLSALSRIPAVIGWRRCMALGVVTLSIAIGTGACRELQRPAVEPFYASTQPPARQQLRWSNGKKINSFDPALAIAPPESDLVRAIYEGLTELHPVSLEAEPGVAERWEVSEDLLTWTFHLRDTARWTNGEQVTARDFERSFRRLSKPGDATANTYLFQNIIGMNTAIPSSPPADSSDSPIPLSEDDGAPREIQPENSVAGPEPSASGGIGMLPGKTFGVAAVNDRTLTIALTLPDKDLPKLLAHPVFRPVYSSEESVGRLPRDAPAITNGQFSIAEAAEDVLLERSETYWNSDAVDLEQIRFVAAASAEAALQMYRNGEVDVVTNAAFEPLAVKLLAPYEDFRRAAHNTLNFYEFNTLMPPFDDRRVREALAIAIDRTVLAESALEGTTQPAFAYSPLADDRDETLTLDVERARSLLKNAGYPAGAGFPVIRLVINRNETQLKVARAVSRMWKQNLGVETDIVQKELSQLETVRQIGDFDIIRRGVVLASNDEMINLSAIFGPAAARQLDTETDKSGGVEAEDSPRAAAEINLDDETIYNVRIVPLYFPVSYALVKPYVRGFELNGLDAPSLRSVSIDLGWRQRNAEVQ